MVEGGVLFEDFSPLTGAVELTLQVSLLSITFVSGPTLPVGDTPTEFWYAFTADEVSLP
jgi:hypothetical protein